jgi:hypothetical protein
VLERREVKFPTAEEHEKVQLLLKTGDTKEYFQTNLLKESRLLDKKIVIR